MQHNNGCKQEAPFDAKRQREACRRRDSRTEAEKEGDIGAQMERETG